MEYRDFMKFTSESFLQIIDDFINIIFEIKIQKNNEHKVICRSACEKSVSFLYMFWCYFETHAYSEGGWLYLTEHQLILTINRA